MMRLEKTNKELKSENSKFLLELNSLSSQASKNVEAVTKFEQRQSVQMGAGGVARKTTGKKYDLEDVLKESERMSVIRKNEKSEQSFDIQSAVSL